MIPNERILRAEAALEAEDRAWYKQGFNYLWWDKSFAAAERESLKEPA